RGLTPGLPPWLPDEDRIVGGQPTTIEKYPYQAKIFVDFIDGYCSGTIISERRVLTAAHCVWSRDISNLHIVVGSSSAERSAQVLKVSAIHEHPSYDHRTFDNDIAILELSSPISFGRGAQPIATAAPGSELPAGTLATITGWGALKSGSSSRNQLYAGLVKIVSISDCRRAYPTHAITDNMFCAVGEGVGGCQVDSGGALLVNGVAYGIYSWGYGCDHPDYHGVYTKLSKYHSFISQFIWKGIIS
ncbi:trypsin-like, partial [Folsomia candida]|uniref:trypsin-like n=1 Tax=Folsomia candida TaxID=158441 RepID=UPI001604CD1F